MKRPVILLTFAMLTALCMTAARYSMSFKSVPLAKALAEFVVKYPDVNITYVYNELNNYRTSATIDTDNAADAIRKMVGRNPVMVVEKGKKIFVESYQKGKYTLAGRVVNEHGESVPYANVLILAPRDSVVMTYGVTNTGGNFSIPCDNMNVLAKISSTGYYPRTMRCHAPDLGVIVLKTHAIDLDEIKIEAESMRLFSDRTVYIPHQRQKNSALTGLELLDRMAIPQLFNNPVSGKIETNSGKPVSIFIDGLPASDSDLTAMNLQDVRRVEYLEYPSDPRFEGNPYVVNFIMVKYEYGGYTKLFGNENFIMNSGNLLFASRFQYKRMTYDLTFLPFYMDNDHYGENKRETFRLPLESGGERTISRFTDTQSSHKTRQQYQTVFKATYNSDRLTVSNMLSAFIDNQPHSDEHGSVVYHPADFGGSYYASTLSDRSKYFVYSGDFFLTVGERNTLSFKPRYSFSHTDRRSMYSETGTSPIFNRAKDNTNQLSGTLRYAGKTSGKSSFSAHVSGDYNYYRTRYSGSADALDRSKNIRVSAGATYDISTDNFYGYVGAGWNWDIMKVNKLRENDNSPYANLSLQYLFHEKNRVSVEASYSEWSPSVSFKSEAVIKADPLMSYTGNPNLVPSKTINLDLSFLHMFSQKFSVTAFVNSWTVKDRFVYDYEATPDGILRTIKQPMGDYMTGGAGLRARLALLDNSLHFSGSFSQDYHHNGRPFNFDRYPRRWSLRADYYVDDFYFSGYYSSSEGYSDGYMVGTWIEYKDSYYLQAGWANSKLNIRVTASDFARWNWRSHKAWFKTPVYDNHSTVSDINSHASFSISATYTFSYGKKVSTSGTPGGADRGDSGILAK